MTATAVHKEQQQCTSNCNSSAPVPESWHWIRPKNNTGNVLLTQATQLLAQYSSWANADAAHPPKSAWGSTRLLQQQRNERSDAATKRVPCMHACMCNAHVHSQQCSKHGREKMCCGGCWQYLTGEDRQHF